MLNRVSFKLLVAAVTAALGATSLVSTVYAKSHVAATVPSQRALLSEPRVLIRGTSGLFNPDGIVITQRYLFVVWQNNSDHQPGDSYVVKYDRTGKALGEVGLPGRADGLRLDPVTNLLWVIVNNDGLNGNPPRQPYIATVDPHTLTAKRYAFAATQPHGGGYDDVAFIGNAAFLSASSPTLGAAGLNDKPIVVKADLTADGKVTISPILYGNSVMWDPQANKYQAENISDPDSLLVNDKNDLVLIGDNDQDVVTIHYPGQPTKQVAVRVNFGTQFDDIAYTKGESGTLFVADNVSNTIYTIDARFPYGTVFSETGPGNPIESFIGTIDGVNAVTPLLTQRDGIYGPTSLEFVPTGGPIDKI